MREAPIPGRQTPSQSKSPAQIEQEAVDWHVRLEAADVGLQQRFAAWLAEDAAHRRAYEAVDALWSSNEFARALSDIQTETTVPSRVKTSFAWLMPGWQYGLAAVVLLAGIAAWQLPELMLRSRADFLTETGQVANRVLPDGSSVTLNSNSAIEVDFSGGQRNIALLRGEAFFAVAPDSGRPFTVLGKVSQVTVTGTEFALRNQDDQELLTVEEGHVLFRQLEQGDAVEVVAGQGAVAGRVGMPVPVAVDTHMALQWREGRVTIADRPLWEAVDELQRYRGGPVILANADRREMLVSGNFRLDDIDDALRSIAVTAGLAVTELPGSVLILH